MSEIETYKQNLKRLEEQAALYGSTPPLIILNDIDFHKEKIRELEAKLTNAKGSPVTATGSGNKPPMSRGDIITFLSLAVAIISCVAAVVVVPEVRRIIGLDAQPTVANSPVSMTEVPVNTPASATQSSDSPTQPVLQPTSVEQATAQVTIVNTPDSAPVNPTEAPTSPIGDFLPLILNKQVEGAIDKDAKPYNIYTLELEAGQNVFITGQSSGSVYIRVFSPGTITFDNLDHSKLVCNFRIRCEDEYAAAVKGTYYIQVSTTSNGVSYSLKVTPKGVPQTSGAPDDVPGVTLLLNKQVISAIDQEANPADVYAVELQAGQKVVVTAKSSGSVYIRVFSPGTVTVANPDHGKLVCNFRIQCEDGYAAAVTGTYYVQVSTTNYGVSYSLIVATKQ